MKTIKNIIAWPIIILLAIVYIIDRVILVLLPWIEVKSIQDWMPKTTNIEEIQKQFQTMSEETIFTIKYTREQMMILNKISFTRVAVTVFVGMCAYLIF